MMKFGFVADGVVKMLVAVALCAFLPAVESFLLAPRWLAIAAIVLLFLSGATEISYGARKGQKSYVKYLAIFDSLWVVSTIMAVIFAVVDSPAAGYVWFGFMGLGSLGIAVIFTTGANGPDFADEPSDGTSIE
ncbi:MAG: hypothetical protein L0G69_15905 [Brevibacterium sp.]|uniref:hypothetical protein n=1 Tax=Brevibacterium sandarakinum TaxID=629680 RepID=UPI00264B9588|nr:hypothetical protein [Brevibacterium sandarakinum]MDN5588038.1 hypothetical protein [Brevibacterium sp.]MDN5658075.1 hypothetical protein [Brevibacterium sandarakinum]